MPHRQPLPLNASRTGSRTVPARHLPYAPEARLVWRDLQDGWRAACAAPQLLAPWASAGVVRRLREPDRPALRAALLGLDAADRQRRFGQAMSDPAIDRYLDGIDWHRQRLYAIPDSSGAIVACSHLAPVGARAPDARAAHTATTVRRVGTAEMEAGHDVELGLLVASHLRGLGLGRRLLKHAVWTCRNAGVRELLIRTAADNTPMLRLMSRIPGVRLQRGGTEVVACVRLRPPTAPSRWIEDGTVQAARWQRRLRRWWQEVPLLPDLLDTPVGDGSPWRPM
jgi:GNAT superfamily N-acetyltransferase